MAGKNQRQRVSCCPGVIDSDFSRMRRRRYLLTMVGAAAIAAFTAAANAQPAPQEPAAPSVLAPKPQPLEKPYKPVAVTVPPAPADPNFAAFRQQLAAAAKTRVHAQLARLVVARGFFWEGDAAGSFNPAARPIENFAAAIGLESKGGAGWNALAAFAIAPGTAPLPSRPGVVCAPAQPDFDPVDFDQLLATTGTQAADWKYLRDAAVPMRVAPRPVGRALETLGSYLVRVLANPDPTNLSWALVAAPSGKTGFIPSSLLLPLGGDRLCFHKDVTGRWQIAGYITAAN
jgi:hypothetical protein